MSKNKQYAARIVDSIREAVESGATLPWRRTWRTGDAPRNALTGRRYRGINVMICLLAAMRGGFSVNAWLTLRQANSAGGKVRKGEKPTWIVFWKRVRKKGAEDEDEDNSFFAMRVYRVYNVAQTEGCDESKLAGFEPLEPLNTGSVIERCEDIIEWYTDAPRIVDGPRPLYRPSTDTVELPDFGDFESPEAFYATAFHELAHSTGHESRLDRGLNEHFDRESYSREELTAEIAAAMLCGEAGIETATIENSASYVAGWLKFLADDPSALVSAAQRAQRAVDYILGTDD